MPIISKIANFAGICLVSLVLYTSDIDAGILKTSHPQAANNIPIVTQPISLEERIKIADISFSKNKYEFDVDCIIHNAGKAVLAFDSKGNKYKISVSGEPNLSFTTFFKNTISQSSFEAVCSGEVKKGRLISESYSLIQESRIFWIFPSYFARILSFDYRNNRLALKEYIGNRKSKSAERVERIDNSTLDPLSVILRLFQMDVEKGIVKNGNEYLLGKVYGERSENIYARILSDSPITTEIEFPERTLIKGRTKFSITYTKQKKDNINCIDIKELALFVPGLNAWATGKIKD